MSDIGKGELRMVWTGRPKFWREESWLYCIVQIPVSFRVVEQLAVVTQFSNVSE